MQINLAPRDARRWVTAQGPDDTFHQVLSFKQDLIIAEFARVSDLLAEKQAQSDITRIFSFPDQALRAVLLHPAGVCCIRSTHLLLVGVGQEGTDIDAACNQLRELMLAAAFLANFGFDTVVELDGRGRLSLPGTGLVLRDIGEPHSSVTVAVREGTEPTLVCDGHAIDLRSRHLMRLPVSRWGDEGVEVNCVDRRLTDRWVAHVRHGGEAAIPVSGAALPAVARELEDAWEVLSGLDFNLAAESAALLRCVVPVVSPIPNHQVSCSADEFFGACQLSARRPIELAEEIAHEYRHNALNALLASDPIIASESPRQMSIYSPWKNVPRPPLGILHAIYSFQEVLSVYTSHLERQPDDAKRREQSAVQAARLSEVMPEFREHVKFTPFGDEFVKEIETRVDALVERTVARSSRLFDRARLQLRKQRERE